MSDEFQAIMQAGSVIGSIVIDGKQNTNNIRSERVRENIVPYTADNERKAANSN